MDVFVVICTVVTDDWVGNNDEAVYFWIGTHASLALQEHAAKVRGNPPPPLVSPRPPVPSALSMEWWLLGVGRGLLEEGRDWSEVVPPLQPVTSRWRIGSPGSSRSRSGPGTRGWVYTLGFGDRLMLSGLGLVSLRGGWRWIAVLLLCR